MIYIIEHLEPRVWKWCLIEYKHISRIVGKKNLWFTNTNNKGLKKYGTVIKKSVRDLKLKNACVLDPEAQKTLNPREAKKFDYVIFGGILGDHPPRKRTTLELTRFVNFPARNIGKEQMSTDNAVAVVHEIAKGKNFRDLKFKKGIEVKINDVESTLFPYTYLVKNKKPLISKDLIAFLRKSK
ncbi:hypothetical protein KW805_00610 [Candidatus Pacearchaeota archaeon]|nr:hypothetical protein [Candidatus Pacearchaeota archaeon]